MNLTVTKEAWTALDEALAQAGDDKDARRKAWEAWEPYQWTSCNASDGRICVRCGELVRSVVFFATEGEICRNCSTSQDETQGR